MPKTGGIIRGKIGLSPGLVGGVLLPADSLKDAPVPCKGAEADSGPTEFSPEDPEKVAKAVKRDSPQGCRISFRATGGQESLARGRPQPMGL